MIIGFTASRIVGEEQAERIRTKLLRLPPNPVVVTGACLGGDQFISQWFQECRPLSTQVVIVPWQTDLVDMEWIGSLAGAKGIEVVLMAKGTTYRDRNFEIVQRSERLIGFPSFGEADPRMRRSGTWQTIRMGYVKGIVSPADIVEISS